MNVKKKLLASLALAALAFCAMSAPIPSYRVATNIADAVSRTVVSNTVTRSYIEGLVSGSGGLVNATDIINDITRDSTQATLINRTDGHEDNAIVTIGSVDKQSNLAGLMTVEDKKTLDLHVANTDNPHGVTAEQVGALSISLANTDQTFDWNPSGGGVMLFGTNYGTGIGLSLNRAGGELFNYHDDTYYWYKLPTGKSGTLAIVDDISATNPTFSDAVLAVGLNIDNETLQWLKDIGAIAGSTTGQVGIGTLLASILAALMWLKKNKVGSFASVGGATATVENGVAKLSNFFTKSNSLLNGRLAYERNETGLKDRAFNSLTFDGTEYNLSTALAAVTPTASGQPRDLLIVATATAATTISYTAGTIKGDKPTIDGSGTWLITLTEYASGVWYCRQIKMEDAA